MSKPLTTRERGEIIGTALDANTDNYNLFLNKNGFPFEGSEDDRRVGAAILTMFHWGYLDDYIEVYEGSNVAPHMSMRWERIVLDFDGASQKYTLRLFTNSKAASACFS